MLEINKPSGDWLKNQFKGIHIQFRQSNSMEIVTGLVITSYIMYDVGWENPICFFFLCSNVDLFSN